MYLLGDAWYKLMPKPVETLAPTIMKPLTKPIWKYISPGALATSGIYSQDLEEDLEELKDHIMFPAEQPAVLNTVAGGIMGQSTLLYGGSISNLIDEASIEKIAISAWHKFWDKFLIFGNISAGMLEIYFCITDFKLIIDMLVHGYVLHAVYGWSLYLLGAIWNSVTQLLLLLGKGRPKAENPRNAVEEGLDERQACTKNDAEPEQIYPALPTKKASTYTFELRN